MLDMKPDQQQRAPAMSGALWHEDDGHPGDWYYGLAEAAVLMRHGTWWIEKRAKDGMLGKYRLPGFAQKYFYKEGELLALRSAATRQRDPLAAIHEWGQYLRPVQVAQMLGVSRGYIPIMIEAGAFNGLAPLSDEERTRGQADSVPPVLRTRFPGRTHHEYYLHVRAVRFLLEAHEWRGGEAPTWLAALAADATRHYEERAVATVQAGEFVKLDADVPGREVLSVETGTDGMVALRMQPLFATEPFLYSFAPDAAVLVASPSEEETP